MPKYIILDTETTGTEKEDRIIQLGFIAAESGKMPIVYESLCKPQATIKTQAMATHHITPEMIAEKPQIKQTAAWEALCQFNTPDNYIIAHNLPFDMEQLEKEGFECKMQKIDTLRCAKHLLPKKDSHALQFLRYDLGIYKDERKEAQKLGVEVRAHDAIGDVLVLKILMRHLMKKADVEELVSMSEKPVFYEKPMKFGKHRGETLREIARKDENYLEWALENMNLDGDMQYSMKKVLDERKLI